MSAIGLRAKKNKIKKQDVRIAIMLDKAAACLDITASKNQQIIASQNISIIERGLNQVLEINPASCTGNLTNPPSSLTPLISAWVLSTPGMSNCEVNVICGVAQHDADNDGLLENYYTLRSRGQCGPPADRAFRLVEVQARG